MKTSIIADRRSNRERVRALTFASVVALSCAACSSSGGGQGEATSETYYEGKTIEWLIPSSAGGGTDASVRMMLPFLEKHLAGHPDVRAFNQENTVASMNQFMRESSAEADATRIVMTSTSATLPWILGEKGVEYDLGEFQALIGSPVGAVVYTSGDSPIQTAADLFTADNLKLGLETVVGGETQTLVGMETLNVPFEPLFGYTSAGAFRIALEQGEINLTYDTSPAYLTEIQGAGLNVRPLFTLGFLDNGELVRDPLFPDLPHIGEVYEQHYGSPPTGPAWDAYMALAPTRFVLNKAVWVHKDAPPAAQEALKNAFAAIVGDDEFQQTKEEFFGPYEFIFGEELDNAVKLLTGIDPAARDWLRNYLSENYDADLG
jgi:hypothetical protein